MDIKQLESYSLADAVKFHRQLNPKLWTRKEELHPEVRKRLLLIAEDFQITLGVSDIDLRDVTISGSNAAYTYTANSDIDLHLIIDIPQGSDTEVYRELFNAKKTIYNSEHDITVRSIPVELYVQIGDEPVVSTGVYSVLAETWLQIPRRQRADVDDVSVRSKYLDLEQRIHDAIGLKDYTAMDKLSKKIRRMRQTGLEQHGEFGPENLAFKMLRGQGVLDRLYDAKTQARSQELSLRERKRQHVKYGFGRDYLDEVGLTPDGTNPSTCEFANESETAVKSDSEVIGDFVEFCRRELDLAREIKLRLRRDPEWSRRNKTFGRYNETTQELEVAVGHRHIMDVLRTLGHELVHQKQNEIGLVPADAGSDGSAWENEANAEAGVLMRRYGKQHPELFASHQIASAMTENTNDDESHADYPHHLVWERLKRVAQRASLGDNKGAEVVEWLLKRKDAEDAVPFYTATVLPYLEKYNFPTPPDGPGDDSSKEFAAMVRDITEHWAKMSMSEALAWTTNNPDFLDEVEELDLKNPAKRASRLEFTSRRDAEFSSYVKDTKVVGKIRGNEVIEARGLFGSLRIYMVINHKTGKNMLSVTCSESKGGVLSDLGLAAAPGNTVSATELYHFLITKLGKTLVADRQTEGSQRVWQRLERLPDVGVHGWLKGRAVNIGTQDPEAYGRDDYDLSPEQLDALGMKLVAYKK